MPWRGPSLSDVVREYRELIQSREERNTQRVRTQYDDYINYVNIWNTTRWTLDVWYVYEINDTWWITPPPNNISNAWRMVEEFDMRWEVRHTVEIDTVLYPNVVLQNFAFVLNDREYEHVKLWITTTYELIYNKFWYRCNDEEVFITTWWNERTREFEAKCHINWILETDYYKYFAWKSKKNVKEFKKYKKKFSNLIVY